MKKVEITIQVEREEYVIKEIEPVSKKNMLLKNLKKLGMKNEQK